MFKRLMWTLWLQIVIVAEAFMIMAVTKTILDSFGHVYECLDYPSKAQP